MYNTTPPPYQQDPNESPDSRAEKINTIWKIVTLIYILGSLGLIMYWEFNDTGLCLVVRSWQAKILDDSYYPVLDIMLVLLLFLIPLFIVKFIVEKVTGVKINNPNYKR